MVILHTTHTRDGQMKDIITMQHHSDHDIQTMISEAFIIRAQPGQVGGFITSIILSSPTIFV